jgi:hypothetical protein
LYNAGTECVDPDFLFTSSQKRRALMSDPQPKPGLRARVHTAPLLKQLGPGIITGAADDDPSGIATYSQGGAQLGFNLL